MRPEIRDFAPYSVTDASGMVKLDAMENPHPWPPELRAEWIGRLRDTPVNRYPDPEAAELKESLRKSEGLDRDQPLVLGNGSDELIQLLCTLFARPSAAVLSVTPSFVMYERCAIGAGMKFIQVPLERERFVLDAEAMLAAVNRHRPSLLFLAYPNNPTGNLFDAAAIAELARAADGLLVMDEAYAPFAGDTWIARWREFDNVVVMRTLSKLGLAGLRLGYLVCASAWAEQLEKLRLPYNINVLTQRSAVFALEHRDVFRRQADEICRQREALTTALAGVEGLRVWPSHANFLLFRSSGVGAQSIFDGLRRRNVLIKNLHGTAPTLRNCLRVTVGTAEENAAFLAALERTLEEKGVQRSGNA
ncbi:MAG TPA: histidinol-phosphate transaminase [Gammaproteobacteria bacterium]|nr:histidinol-phosphate transaminase [Gammaproteobacteria bacterium]